MSVTEYDVYNKEDPDRKIKVRSKRKINAAEAKKMVLRCGLFDKKEKGNLRAKKKRRV